MIFVIAKPLAATARARFSLKLCLLRTDRRLSLEPIAPASSRELQFALRDRPDPVHCGYDSKPRPSSKTRRTANTAGSSLATSTRSVDRVLSLRKRTSRARARRCQHDAKTQAYFCGLSRIAAVSRIRPKPEKSVESKPKNVRHRYVGSTNQHGETLLTLVRGTGLEPAHLAVPEPKSGASAIPPSSREQQAALAAGCGALEYPCQGCGAPQLSREAKAMAFHRIFCPRAALPFARRQRLRRRQPGKQPGKQPRRGQRAGAQRRAPRGRVDGR